MDQVMRHELERRRNFRASGRGAAVVHGRSFALRGEVADLSLGGALVRCAPGPAPVPARGTQVLLELEVGGGWIAQHGLVRRCDIGLVAVQFAYVGPETEDAIEDFVLASVEAHRTPCVVVLDPEPPRRRRMSQALRRAGCESFEAATPLEAIHRVETSRSEVTAVAVAEHASKSASEELVDYFSESNPHIKIAVLADGTGPARHIPLVDVAVVCDGGSDDALYDVLVATLAPREAR
jgi:hypothetical protein